MIPFVPEFAVFRIPLDVAGDTLIRQSMGYIHLWRFENADGSISLDGEVLAQFGTQGNADDALPMGYDARLQLLQPVDMMRLFWQAQPGRRAVFLVSRKAEGIEAKNPPSKIIVTPNQGPIAESALQGVTSGFINLRPANAFRLRCVIQSLDTNVCPVWIGGSNLTNAAQTRGQGLKLDPGASFTVTNYSGPIYGSTPIGLTASLRIWEERAA